MKNLPLAIVLFCVATTLSGQNALPERIIDFTVEVQGNTHVFTPVMPALVQKPGAPKAYWSYFWEFGDGGFSYEANPSHLYTRPGDYTASLDATAHYDDGKKAKRKKKPVSASSSNRLAGTGPQDNDVFDPKARQMVAMYSYSKPKAEEEITLIISYRNLGIVPTDGRLPLFFNEKKYPGAHFAFTEARTHYGELPDMSTSQVLPLDNTSMMGWTALPTHSSAGVSCLLSDDYPPSTIIEEMLNNARGAYREENAWQFRDLEAGAKRNMFVSLACTPGMLRDTNAMIHLEAVFAPFDPAVAPERFVYEIEIVSSHDPNAIAVSDNRVSYRTLGNKKLDYKIQFQNNGEGPASKVEVRVDIPKGLKMNAMRPVSWYPKCPICPKTPTTLGCLDTLTQKDGLVFTFRNIYLPGSRQEDVGNRDSTKGFVKYRIEADKNMPKRSFRSRAKIVFDKNPPIYTNYTKTRFKIGISPGLKVGYAIDPHFSIKNDGEDIPVTLAQNGYFSIGASISPFKSWRLYPQIELLTGIKGRVGSDQLRGRDSIPKGFSPSPTVEEFNYTIVETGIKRERGFVSFEIPVLLRKNFSRFVGFGIGLSTRVILENGTDGQYTNRTDYKKPLGGNAYIAGNTYNIDSTPYKNTRFQYTTFADLTLGSVRVGPNLGIRGGVVMGENKNLEPFAQLSLELKL